MAVLLLPWSEVLSDPLTSNFRVSANRLLLIISVKFSNARLPVLVNIGSPGCFTPPSYYNVNYNMLPHIRQRGTRLFVEFLYRYREGMRTKTRSAERSVCVSSVAGRAARSRRECESVIRGGTKFADLSQRGFVITYRTTTISLLNPTCWLVVKQKYKKN